MAGRIAGVFQKNDRPVKVSAVIMLEEIRGD